MVTTHRTLSLREAGMLLGLSVLWGGAFLFTGVAVRDLPPFTLVAARLALAALVLNVVVLLFSARLPRDRASWMAFATMGLLNNAIPFCLIVWGQTQIASGLAAILNATTPLSTVLVAHVLTADEKLTGPRLLGVVVGLAGIVVMVGPDVLAGLGTGALAQAAVLLATVSYAFAGVYGRRFGRMGLTPLATATAQVTASTLILLPVALAIDRPWTLPVPGAAALGATVALAVFSTALAFLVYFRLLAAAGATNISLVTLLVPIWAVLLGALVLGERLEPRHAAGMALVAAGLAAIDGRLLARLADRWRPGRRSDP